MQKETIYKPEEVVKFLGISPRTLETLLKNHEIEFFRVGRQRRIKESALKAYIDKNTEKGASNNEQEHD